ARRRHWSDQQAMQAELQDKALYKNWHPDALAAFIEYGSKPCADGVELCCDPQWESSIFGSYPRGLWQAVRRIKVPVDILVAEHSYSFIAKSARKAAAANANIRYQQVAGSHCFPMEQVEDSGKFLNSLLS